MSQQRDVIEQKGPHQVVHIRSDSETKLDELFNAVIHPKDYQVPLTVPMRLRNLPPSFFQQPEKGSKSASHSRESSTDGTTYTSPPSVPAGSPQPQQQVTSGLKINHPRAHSSPASLQQAYSSNTSQHQHLRQQSYDIIDDNTPLPPGWEMAKTATGQTYFLNHLTQTTTWVDPRKKSASCSPAASSQTLNLQNLGPLPKGWEQATTPDGEVYFINHIERTTSWLDPRIPAHLQSPPSTAQSPPVSSQHPQSLPSQPSHQTQGQTSTTSNQTSQLASPNLSLAASLAALTTASGSASEQANLQQRQQKLRLQRLQMERERLRLRQQEIFRQNACIGNPLLNEMLLRQSLGDQLIPTTTAGTDTSAATELSSLSTSLDSFLEGVTDFHSRQESADSGLGLGPNYSLPNTPEDFLSSMDDVDDQSTDLGLDLQTANIDLGDENMDSDDLIPSLQEELNADILSDVEALLTSSSKDSVLTWL